MDIQLILGPNGSGKSLYAEEQAVRTGAKLCYLATMVAQTEENRRRIEKHRIQRRDKGFRTVEQDWHIDRIPVSPDEVVLLEDASNLVANGIFAHGADGGDALRQILALAEKCRRVIVVSIGGLSEEGYDSETAGYIRTLNALNRALGERACSVVEMKDGVPVRRT